MTPAWCVLAETASQTLFRFARLQAMSEWWHWMLLISVGAAIIAYVVVMYWFDCVELNRGLRWSLVLLRLFAFGGILFFFLDLEKRTQEEETKPSRAAVLVDTSQSMGLKDASGGTGAPSVSRMEQVVQELRRGELLKDLRAKHDVTIYQFDERVEPAEVAHFSRLGGRAQGQDSAEEVIFQRERDLQVARRTVLSAGVLAGVAAVSLLVYLLFGRRATHRRFVGRRFAPRGATAEESAVGSARADATSYSLLVCMVSLIAAAVIFAVANLRAPDLPLRVLVGLQEPDIPAQVEAELASNRQPQEQESDQPTAVEPDEVLWQQSLVPQGSETRIGDAIKAVVTKERGGPIAGVVVISDGGSNAGQAASLAASAASVAGIPIYCVGLGSDRQPVNVQVVDLEAPKRVYPGDKFSLTGYIQAYGLAGRSVNVELLSTPADDATPLGEDPGEKATLEDERSLRLPTDGEVVTVKFEVTPGDPGPHQYFMKVISPEQDIEKRDDTKGARVTVVQRKTKVLLLAGGPSREYRFLRNQLYRDGETTVHALLQSGMPGMSQEAHELLTELPEVADELFQYDCIVAFDPDWKKFNEQQIDLLDRFVAEQAGGLIVLAGPVNTPQWAGERRGRDPRIDTIKSLYPVVFYSQGVPSLGLGRFGGDAAWPLSFTRDGAGAEFLWLADDPVDSEAAWQSFEGIYGYYAVKDPKPGARVYARFSNPDTSIDGELPIYAAAHFYGAGRVYFQASGEMWRLRAVDPHYFETYYTKLIRWVSQGRLMRDSSRGVLLVDKDRCLLGDQITIRAALSDVQHQPLKLDNVPAILVQPDGERVAIVLRKVQDSAREGMYEAQFTTTQAGDYRIEVTPTDGGDEELLSADVRVRVPALEIERPLRNDVLLKELADKTGGEYFIGFDAAMNRGGVGRATLASVLQPNDQVIHLPDSVDARFDEHLMGWLLALIVGVLCIEWLIRRMSKLA